MLSSSPLCERVRAPSQTICARNKLPNTLAAPTTQWPFFVAFCSEGWFQFNDEKCVRIISSQALNFYESQELCRSKYNSKLLSIKTDKESEFVHNLIKFRDIKLPVWLGAVQNDFSSFNWIDKSEVTFTNWAEGEPNDPDHACISMQASSGAKWSDNDCKEQKLILCQKGKCAAAAACGAPSCFARLNCRSHSSFLSFHSLVVLFACKLQPFNQVNGAKPHTECARLLNMLDNDAVQRKRRHFAMATNPPLVVAGGQCG